MTNQPTWRIAKTPDGGSIYIEIWSRAFGGWEPLVGPQVENSAAGLAKLQLIIDQVLEAPKEQRV